MKKILIVAGEYSGDELASSIIKELNSIVSTPISFIGCGGNKMKNMNVEILYHIDDLAIVGFTEVIKKYFFIKKVIKNITSIAVHNNIQEAILIDYQGFNLLLAKELNKYGIKCYKIVSPQIWAWRPKRIYKVKKYFNMVLCLFSFEIKLYTDKNIKASFIGHPLIYKILNYQKEIKWVAKKYKNTDAPCIALLPGSRIHEIKNHVPFLIEVAKEVLKKYPKASFLMPIGDKKLYDFIKNKLNPPNYIQVQLNTMYDVLSVANAALIASGTATLEAALWKVPFILIYKSTIINSWITQSIVITKYMGLMNNIAKKMITQEFWQQYMTIKNVIPELFKLLENNQYREQILEDFQNIIDQEYINNPCQNAANVIQKEIF